MFATPPPSQAEKLEQEDESNRENEMFGSAGIAKFGPRVASLMEGTSAVGGELGGGAAIRVEEPRAVVMINAQCTIQMANKGAYSMFGYNKRNELRGKNVNVLIPVRNQLLD